MLQNEEQIYPQMLQNEEQILRFNNSAHDFNFVVFSYVLAPVVFADILQGHTPMTWNITGSGNGFTLAQWQILTCTKIAFCSFDIHLMSGKL